MTSQTGILTLRIEAAQAGSDLEQGLEFWCPQCQVMEVLEQVHRRPPGC